MSITKTRIKISLQQQIDKKELRGFVYCEMTKPDTSEYILVMRFYNSNDTSLVTYSYSITKRFFRFYNPYRYTTSSLVSTKSKFSQKVLQYSSTKGYTIAKVSLYNDSPNYIVLPSILDNFPLTPLLENQKEKIIVQVQKTNSFVDFLEL